MRDERRDGEKRRREETGEKRRRERDPTPINRREEKKRLIVRGEDPTKHCRGEGEQGPIVRGERGSIPRAGGFTAKRTGEKREGEKEDACPLAIRCPSEGNLTPASKSEREKGEGGTPLTIA